MMTTAQSVIFDRRDGGLLPPRREKSLFIFRIQV